MSVFGHGRGDNGPLALQEHGVQDVITNPWGFGPDHGMRRISNPEQVLYCLCVDCKGVFRDMQGRACKKGGRWEGISVSPQLSLHVSMSTSALKPSGAAHTMI
jgi:hypothetical protein